MKFMSSTMLHRATFALMLTGIYAASASAQIFWDGGGVDNDFNDPINWATDMEPAASENVEIGDPSFIGQAVADVTATPTNNPIGDLVIGRGAFADGVVNHSSGDIITDDFKWTIIGADGSPDFAARGEYNLSGDATFTQFQESFADSTYFVLGTGGGRKDTGAMLPTEGYFSIADTAVATLNNFFVANNDDNFAQVDQTGGTVNVNNWVSIGRETGADGVYNMSGGALNVTNDGITVGESTGATGIMNLSNDATINAGRLQVGRSLVTNETDGGGTGTLNIDGTSVSITVGRLSVGASDEAVTDGQGTINFDDLGAGTLPTVNVLEDITLNDGTSDGFADLFVTLDAGATGDITLFDLDNPLSTITGTFANLAEGAVVPGTPGYTITYTGGDGNDIVLEDPNAMMGIDGDFDMDGDVDGVDLGVFGFSFANSPEGGPPFAPGDFDMDGDVDGVDLGVFGFNFVNFPPVPSTSVPEPSAVLLAGLALAGFVARRK